MNGEPDWQSVHGSKRQTVHTVSHQVNDSVVERKVLRENVFPKLRNNCRRRYGVDFRVIDPYEETNPGNWPSQQERLQLLEECRQNSQGPFLLALVGEQYGAPCLPEQVEQSEFQTVLQVCQQMRLNLKVLERCYRRDENTIPSSFSLLSQDRFTIHPSQAGQTLEENSWQDTLTEAGKILNKVVTQCVLKGKIDPVKADKYFQSGLEKDLRFALEGRSNADVQRCLCYIHKDATKADEKKIENKPCSVDQSMSERLSQLRDDFLPSLVKTRQALVYTTTTNKCVGKMSYAEELGQHVYLDLFRLINTTIVRERNQIHDSFSQQRNLCYNLSRLYRIERAEMSRVNAYLEQDTVHPFVLTGGPCTGKTVFLAHCASQMKTWMKDQDPDVIMHFTDINTSLKQLLSSICHQISLSRNQPCSTCTTDISQLKETFNNLLTLNSSRLLVLILDGLDQLSHTNGPLDWTWLPRTLPSNVKLLISSTPRKSGLLSALKTLYPESSLFFELAQLDSKNCNQMLTALLLETNRRITSGQQWYVNQAFKECSLPLYVELLFKQLCTWGSELEITSDTLVPGVHLNIGRFIDHLEEKHGSLLVAKALQYLTLSRYGLTEAELTDILSCDDEVLLTYLSGEDCAPYKLRVPEVVVERLLLDLKGFLITRNMSDTQTLSWVSRHFNLVVHKRYLSSDIPQKIHAALANYFSGRWSCGTAKPMTITSPDMKTPNQQVSQNAVPMKIYTDRQVPGQPWMFQPVPSNLYTSSSSECARPNLRKLQELPFHLLKSENFEELGHMVMSQEFLHVMLSANIADELILWLEKTSQKVFTRELRLLAAVLKTSTCMLKNNPSDLSLVLQAKLFPFMHVFPELAEYVTKSGHNGTFQNFAVNYILFPTPPVPDTHWLLPAGEDSLITKAAVCKSGYVLVIQSNGSAWVWNMTNSEAFKLPWSSELQFTDVRCSANVFLLSTQSGKLLLWDINAPSHLLELQTQHSKQGQKSILTTNDILVSNDKMFIFSRESSSACVFVGEMEMASLRCSLDVTCIACSANGNIVCCGQKEGVVSIFESQTGQPLTSFVCSTRISLFDLNLDENGETIMCVDCIGSVFVWDLQMITKPILVKEKLSWSHEEVLNINYSESNLLLLCKRQLIQVMSLPLLEINDQFKAPKGKFFVQAVLDDDAHFIIALMEDCPFLLVWNCISGQCVLNLDIRSTQAFEVIKLNESCLTAITSTGIVTWDIDLIMVAASTAKFGNKVTHVVVDPDGEHFYTANGSKLVWRWTLGGGTVEGHLQHNGHVETLVISADGTYIVSIAFGDIYVWNTSTKENVHRIYGSQASQVLLTPKGSFAVALSKTGPSRVWKLCSGHVICSIHHHLTDAVISPESTFILGINRGDLLAVSLWSGYVSKRFSCSDCSEVVSFQPLSGHPDYVIVITNRGALYSWRLTEETICHQFQFPESFQCPPQFFKLSSDGAYGLISVLGTTIKVLDIYHGKLCTLNAEGPVYQSLADISNKYAVYVCTPSVSCQNRSCDIYTKHVLVVVRIKDGKRLGKFYLCKNPSVVTLSEKLCVYVGFEGGSVGVYSINDTKLGKTTLRAQFQATGLPCPFDEPSVWLPLAKPNLTWVEFTPEFL